MDAEKLIQLVRNSPVLYDQSNSKYTNSDFRNTIWSEIAAEMKTTASSCRFRWWNIRDNFRKSLKKNKTVSDQNAKNMKQYKYAKQLSFLKKFVEDRDTMTNIDDEVINQDSTCDDNVTVSVLRENAESIQDYSTENDNNVTGESKSNTSFNSKQAGSIQCPISLKKMKHLQSVPNATPVKTAAATVMEYLVREQESMAFSPSPPQHPVDAFLTGIAPALKHLSPHNWHYARADIFAAVQKYEFKMLVEQQQFSGSSSSSSTQIYSEQPAPAGSSCQTTSLNEYQTTFTDLSP